MYKSMYVCMYVCRFACRFDSVINRSLSKDREPIFISSDLSNRPSQDNDNSNRHTYITLTSHAYLRHDDGLSTANNNNNNVCLY